MANSLIAQGVLPADLANALRSKDPSSPTYVSLLSRAVAYGPTPWLSYQLVNEMDGQPGISATRGGWDPRAKRGQSHFLNAKGAEPFSYATYRSALIGF